MHQKEVMIDLKVARRESGLRQSDVAHLLEVSQSRISNLECGEGYLSPEELCRLLVIYDRTLDELLPLTMQKLRSRLKLSISNMSGDLSSDPEFSEQRQKTLYEVLQRLEDSQQSDYGA